MKQFTLEYWEDEGWYVGRLVEIPGIFSQGETFEELKENIQDAYEIMLKSEPVNIVPASAHRVSMELGSLFAPLSKAHRPGRGRRDQCCF